MRSSIVNLLLTLLGVATSCGASDVIIHRGASYEAGQHHALLGQSFMNISGISAVRCAARCLSHHGCSSFNYNRSNRVCQMNNATEPSLGGLQEMQTFTHYEATQNSASTFGGSLKEPVCTTEGRLGIENDSIPDGNLTASSVQKHNPNMGNKSTVSGGRLNKIPPHKGFVGAWYPNVSDVNQWIQVDLGSPTYVTGVLTQGRHDHPQWVTKYKVQYQPPTQKSLVDVENKIGETTIFVGNTDRSSIVERRFDWPIRAVKVRIVPVEWKECIALRFELLGCK